LSARLKIKQVSDGSAPDAPPSDNGGRDSPCLTDSCACGFSFYRRTDHVKSAHRRRVLVVCGRGATDGPGSVPSSICVARRNRVGVVFRSLLGRRFAPACTSSAERGWKLGLASRLRLPADPACHHPPPLGGSGYGPASRSVPLYSPGVPPIRRTLPASCMTSQGSDRVNRHQAASSVLSGAGSWSPSTSMPMIRTQPGQSHPVNVGPLISAPSSLWSFRPAIMVYSRSRSTSAR
jgi:hypothetical protein